MTPVTAVVVGAGSRGATYAEYAHERPEELRIVGVAEPRAAYRARFAERHGLAGSAVVADWRELVAGPRCADAVVIATPDALHADPAVAFAERGYAVLLEKPMAPTEQECRRIVAAAERSGALLAVCHVLRYTEYTRALRRLLDEGAIGRLVSIQHLEPIGWWHFAHSFVRGSWAVEADSSSLLLAKSCHDVDLLVHLAGAPVAHVASYGGLAHFRPEDRPPGATDRCVTCPWQDGCAYSATGIYLPLADAGETGWPLDVLTPAPTPATVRAALEEGPYGRCVYSGRNDVLDHQVLAMQFANGVTASFSLAAFTSFRARETRLMGTAGELVGDGRRIRVFDFRTRQESEIDTAVDDDGSIMSGHGGGDRAIVEAFVRAVATGETDGVLSGAQEALGTHLAVFAAERARRAAGKS